MSPQAGKRFPLEVATARLSLDTTPLAGKLFLRAGNKVQVSPSLAEVRGKTIPLLMHFWDLWPPMEVCGQPLPIRTTDFPTGLTMDCSQSAQFNTVRGPQH